ncbi:hypothetical protein BSKO_05806 [Bryopsis sp. KO-2023]|nr:hypothetical protein BSKO_05806 [Bryopsis sp. KO-2023]
MVASFRVLPVDREVTDTAHTERQVAGSDGLLRESGYWELARLSRACWLELEGDLHDVPRGLYVARWRIKLDRVEYHCSWRVKQFREAVDADGRTEQVLVREEVGSHSTDTDTCTERMRQLLRSKVGKGWFYLELSIWNLQEGAKRLSFSLCGGDPNWCSAMKIDSFELVPYRLDWGVERLLWLGCLKDKDSSLHCLPRNVVAIVLQRLAAAEAAAEGEMMPRARNCEDVSVSFPLAGANSKTVPSNR